MRERAFLHVAWLCFQIMQAEAFVPFLDSSLHNSISTTLLENFSAGAAIDWIKDENLESLLPKDDALAICNELLSNKSLIDDSEALVEENWDKIENRIRNENRSAKEILGEETTEREVMPLITCLLRFCVSTFFVSLFRLFRRRILSLAIMALY
jgi:hypothetical protein